ncbi:hypothetical protein N658DRAFT_427580 [Parathielavia hyrcaniae]|uniref:Uncharacterized protein n=1 Tax=Parathielavia hyrcaniae TaxID=113614 RepID=A0AAN6PZA4_9PEZI|nr:hypothetical protein N658DRAFT_427580 [Parathielavia hyrcaniae]
MDALLEYLGHHAIKSATNYGFNLTFGYALQQCSRLRKSVHDKAARAELKALQRLLDGKIKILSPALDLIEFKYATSVIEPRMRNTFLESAVPLAKSLRRDIVRLGKRLGHAAGVEETGQQGPRSEAHDAELLLVIKDIKALLDRIDRDIPLLQFAITVSGEKMSTTMTPGISPSRMMQASALLSFTDAHFVLDRSRPMQVGPSFTLSLYMLFLGHSQVGPNEARYGLGAGDRKPIWQEVMHKARVRLCRTPANWAFDSAQGYWPNGVDGTHGSAPLSDATALPRLELPDGYSYHLEIIEDLDDGRLHDGDGPNPRPYDELQMAGIRESIPIHQVSKLFYTDTGRILNIGNSNDGDNHPVLLLKRDPQARSPTRMRQEWLDVREAALDTDESQFDSLSASESFGSEDQENVDRQLLEETAHSAESPHNQDNSQRTNLPQHLDPEWLALEVYTEEEGDGDEEHDDEEEGDDASANSEAARPALTASHHAPRGRDAVDSKLMSQIRQLSLRAGSPPQDIGQPSVKLQKLREDAYATRSPFGSITSSLSLLELLIRLTSLQEFQQTSHLAIPDHILTFFLEETSTTGLQGEEHWQMRSEAKQRMGFDPYTDALPRQNEE